MNNNVIIQPDAFVLLKRLLAAGFDGQLSMSGFDFYGEIPRWESSISVVPGHPECYHLRFVCEERTFMVVFTDFEEMVQAFEGALSEKGVSLLRVASSRYVSWYTVVSTTSGVVLRPISDHSIS